MDDLLRVFEERALSHASAALRKGRAHREDMAAAVPTPFTSASAMELYEYFVRVLRGMGLQVTTGQFREMMDVHLTNDGPVTLMLDSQKAF